ncbi:2-hydroxyhepta-2,4-diene-1,7-dioate isomerase [Asanoa ishikariensis]|uniref:2-keto-4-pentenoate hydratase/2-oxohepta-3-ene-1,7-dioic acid hydratase (Catechol pathway) n=1 Tax=Asanoa ishikariensis TaxID=137265 RepID=A0A1H3LPW6_9ACTN|nr:fumarylacetoacetate hydrolase family protein [Asanoa ishikariensis]GIF65619.1 2-hydroxyhepta-2,4-diene-1,7-dioate isomerase [Asanoa ishikariensis]SDY66482.1 2-keto-4-pentenoate hydratase/2-oxohepta-3-ene-1,7-dioic acid hydratase (catechol pathway) [Asanoa ishikariensis]
MRLVTYRRAGEVRHGRLTDDDRVVEFGDGDLEGYLDGRTGETGRLEVAVADVELLAPLLRPGKLLAAAANYQDHVTESGAEPLDKTRLSPRLFLKPSTSIVGPDATIPLPAVSSEVDWEAELAVVIGRRVRDIAEADALDAVAGYMTSNDVSARSVDYGFPRDTDDKMVWFFDWLAGKWLDGFAPLGPWLVTADEVPDPQALSVHLDVNGVTKQTGSTKDMIFSVAELVAHASRLMTLEPGDVILTGTPSGVGAATGEFLKAGDVMTVVVGPLGQLRNTVA